MLEGLTKPYGESEKFLIFKDSSVGLDVQWIVYVPEKCLFPGMALNSFPAFDDCIYYMNSVRRYRSTSLT